MVSTPTGLWRCSLRPGHNPVGVGASMHHQPKVARSSQPWALSRNPFGTISPLPLCQQNNVTNLSKCLANKGFCACSSRLLSITRNWLEWDEIVVVWQPMATGAKARTRPHLALGSLSAAVHPASRPQNQRRDRNSSRLHNASIVPLSARMASHSLWHCAPRRN